MIDGVQSVFLVAAPLAALGAWSCCCSDEVPLAGSGSWRPARAVSADEARDRPLRLAAVRAHRRRDGLGRRRPSARGAVGAGPARRGAGAIARFVGNLRVHRPGRPGARRPSRCSASVSGWSSTTRAWAFGQLWVLLALGLFGGAFAIGAAHQSRAALGAERALERGDEHEARRQLTRWSWGYRADRAAAGVAAWDMVFKPGARSRAVPTVLLVRHAQARSAVPTTTCSRSAATSRRRRSRTTWRPVRST